MRSPQPSLPAGSADGSCVGSLAGRSWLDHKNQTLSAVVFLDRPSAVDWPTRCAGQNVSDEHAVYPSGDCALPDILRYKVYYNDTTRYSRASRTYTPFYPLDATREVQRAVDEAVITLRGRRAGLQNCNDTIIAVNSSDAGNESYWVPVPAGMALTRARLQCGAGKNCAYDNRELEGHPPPNGSISTAHLDPSSEGPGEHAHPSPPHCCHLLIWGGCGVKSRQTTGRWFRPRTTPTTLRPASASSATTPPPTPAGDGSTSSSSRPSAARIGGRM